MTISANIDWFVTFITNTLKGIDKFISETIEAVKTFAVENRHVVFPLVNMGKDVLIQYLQQAKNQNYIWYNQLNRLEGNNKTGFNTIPNLPYYSWWIYYKKS